MKVAVVACMLLLAWSVAQAHGGGLNAEGCHHNRKTGDYHCHRAPSIPRPVDKPRPDDEGRHPAARFAPAANEPAKPTCHVGPRGGTYTITPSGRKNYAGC
jgi:hypothetical protein